MAETKTKPTVVDPAAFIAAVEPPAKRADAEVLDALFRRVTGQPGKMWGPTIVGYGSYHYRYASGHEGRAARVGFSPRKVKHSLYLLGCGGEGEDARFEALLARLGKHSRAVACVRQQARRYRSRGAGGDGGAELDAIIRRLDRRLAVSLAPKQPNPFVLSLSKHDWR